MTQAEAWAYAAEWGSLITADDPGACMYGFSPDFRVQSETHRTACLDWLAGCWRRVLDRPEDFAADELVKLDDLVEAIRAAPLFH